MLASGDAGRVESWQQIRAASLRYPERCGGAAAFRYVLWVICGALVSRCGCEVLESMRQVDQMGVSSWLLVDLAEGRARWSKRPQTCFRRELQASRDEWKGLRDFLKPAR